MGIWTAVIAGLFVYVGAMFLMSHVVTGTSDALNIVRNVVPVTIAVVTVAGMWKVFK